MLAHSLTSFLDFADKDWKFLLPPRTKNYRPLDYMVLNYLNATNVYIEK